MKGIGTLIVSSLGTNSQVAYSGLIAKVQQCKWSDRQLLAGQRKAQPAALGAHICQGPCTPVLKCSLNRLLDRSDFQRGVFSLIQYIATVTASRNMTVLETRSV